MNRIHYYFSNSQFSTIPGKDRLLHAITPYFIRPAIQAFRSLDRYLFILVFREIRQSGDSNPEEVFNGQNIIAKLREMQHPVIGRDKDRQVFDLIEKFARELIGIQDLTLEIPASDNRVVISMHGKRLPLESYGTGIHHLLLMCSALAIHKDYFVAIEEPEVHLHPELQLKFLRFISTETTNIYFITTHSNVFLDFQPDVNVYHVRHDGNCSTVDHATTSSLARTVLTDVGYKASDLLQTNGILWVEGPSDRVYLNKWLSLLAPELVEGILRGAPFFGQKKSVSSLHFAGLPDRHLVVDLASATRLRYCRRAG